MVATTAIPVGMTVGVVVSVTPRVGVEETGEDEHRLRTCQARRQDGVGRGGQDGQRSPVEATQTTSDEGNTLRVWRMQRGRARLVPTIPHYCTLFVVADASITRLPSSGIHFCITPQAHICRNCLGLCTRSPMGLPTTHLCRILCYKQH